ncbi:MAG TPA: FAD-dependent oxidoreductase, partial [Spirochaetales bacterium]|nr:FAD-dependent oxidoreductase [Spirochaetales bacterium]
MKRVVVIGGGVLGAASAYYLAKAGHSVTLLEKGELCSGASGANLGQISLLDRDEPWHARLAVDSLRVYDELVKTADIEFERTGGIAVLQDEEQLAAAREMAAQLAPAGVEVNFLFGEDMKKAEPHIDPKAALAVAHCPDEGRINPLKTTLAFLDMARNCGADVRQHAPVTGFVRENGRIVSVQTDAGEFPCDAVVNAAGAWAKSVGALLGLSIPVEYHRGTAFVSQPVAPVLRGPVVGGGFLLKSRLAHVKRRIGLAAVQSHCGSVIIAQATEEAPLESRDITVQGFCLTARRFLSIFPSLETLEIVRDRLRAAGVGLE